MQLFYSPIISENNDQIIFDKEESRHIVKVLRKKEGDLLYITDGNGTLFEVEILISNQKKCIAQFLKKEKKERSRSYYLHMAIAPTKNIGRFEWFLEKATEIGVDEITPIVCKNSERKIVKIDRLQKIIQGGMKQSLQFHLPVLNPPIKYYDFVNKHKNDQLFIAHCEEAIERKTLDKLITPNRKYTILIGPEGDFSPEEIKQALDNDFSPISLGKNRLRTETAGITCVQHVSFIHL